LPLFFALAFAPCSFGQKAPRPPANTNQSRSFNSFIVKGAGNLIQSNSTNVFIGAGLSNVVSSNSFGAVIPGGTLNRAGGTNSLAAGSRAGALHNGTFVWGDSQSADFASTGEDQFLVRARRGVGINTNDPGTNALLVNGRARIEGDLEVSGEIIGTVTVSNAVFSTVTASNAFTVEAGGTSGLTVGAQANDATYTNLFGRNMVGGYAGNLVSAGVVGAAIAGGGALEGTNNYRNAVTGSFGTVGGGLNNSAGPFSVVAGGEGNRASTNYSSALGGFYNEALGSHSTVAGGGGNTASGAYSFAAGRQAKALHNGAFVWADNQGADFASSGSNQLVLRATGGVGINTNNPGTNALLVRGSSRITGNLQVDGAILAGTGNSTTNATSVTGGGVGNTNAGAQSVIAGGASNSVYPGASGAVVGGGRLNVITNSAALSATVAGGEQNISQANHTFIGGGFNNQATAPYAIVSGGQINRAGGAGGTGNHALVAGGYENEADGAYSAVVGGSNNAATGFGSFAAGVRAGALHDHAFVWGGSPAADTVSTNANSFTVHAPGGSFFISGTNGAGEPVGAILAAGTTAWGVLSDSNSKTDFAPIEPREILSKVAALPVTAWHYKHDPKRRYIGPMAQDFRAAFGLGSDDKTISTLDTDGVMFAAIQGLLEEIELRDRRISELETRSREQAIGRAELEQLKSELRTLREQMRGTLPPAAR